MVVPSRLHYVSLCSGAGGLDLAVRISVPRLPYPRPDRNGVRADRWRDWMHAVKFYSRLTLHDGKFCHRVMPVVIEPCVVRATIRWSEDDPEAQSHAMVRSQGILDALARSGIASQIEGFSVAVVLVPVEQMGTDIEIETLEVP